MEGSHGQLCTRLTDGLSSNNTNSLTNLYCFTGCHVRTVALRTHTNVGFTGQSGTDLDLIKRVAIFIHTFCYNDSCTLRCDHMICFYKNVAIFITDIRACKTSCNTLLQRLDHLFSVSESTYFHSRNLIFALCTVCLTNDQLLRYVNQTSGQVTRVSGTKSGIGHTFTCSMSRHEVLQYVKTFTEVGCNRQLDGMTSCIGHQSTHTGKLFDLFIRTTGTGVSHHEDVIVFIQTIHQELRQYLSRSQQPLYNALPQ